MPSTPWQILKILIILILVIIETAFNGVYLAEGNEQGLLGGTTYAVSIAIINIGFACILSFFGVKHLFSCKFLKEIIWSFFIDTFDKHCLYHKYFSSTYTKIGASADNFW